MKWENTLKHLERRDDALEARSTPVTEVFQPHTYFNETLQTFASFVLGVDGNLALHQVHVGSTKRFFCRERGFASFL